VKPRRPNGNSSISVRVAALIGAVATSYFGVPTAFSAVKKSGDRPSTERRREKPEIYSAVEDGEETIKTAPAIAQPVAAPMPERPQIVEQSLQKKVSFTSQLPAVFDPVPAKYVDTVAKRLDLVARLIREHGRAYDYRVLTAKELEQILSSLKVIAPSHLPAPKLLPPQILDET